MVRDNSTTDTADVNVVSFGRVDSPFEACRNEAAAADAEPSRLPLAGLSVSLGKDGA